MWQLIEFLLEGFIFLLIGQQVPGVVHELQSEPSSRVIAAAAVTIGVVLLVRPLWLVLTQLIPAGLHARLGITASEPLHRPELIALSWSGTRGVITLAALFAVPLTTEQGAPFPERDLLLLCGYVVVLATLVGQGLTFAPLLRSLKLSVNAAEVEQLHNEARLAAVDAAVSTVRRLHDQGQIGSELATSLRASLAARADRYRARRAALSESDEGDISWPQDYRTAIQARRAVIDAQRAELVRWRDTGRLPDSSLRTLRRELDHEERAIAEL